MRVSVNVTIEVNEQDWADEYGCETGEVRADVRRWAQDRLNSYDNDIARVVGVR